ncbi:MAG: B12-binding domain-containing radical SAM protein [Candidatus Woesearchaeota archaeon]
MILLLNVKNEFFNIKENNRIYFQPGLLRLVSTIKKHGFKCRFYDFNIVNISIDSLLRKEKPKFVLISFYSDNRNSAIELIKKIKKKKKNIKIIIGGRHATFMFKQLLENYPIDFIVLGEGESTIVELLKELSKSKKVDYKKIKKIKGIAFKHGNRIFYSYREPIKNLSSLPFLDLEEFKENFRIAHFNYKRRLIAYLTSRGCIFNCIYCKTKFFENKNNKFDIEFVLEELKRIKKEINPKVICIEDETLNLDQRIEELSKRLINQKIKIKWWALTRVDRNVKIETFKLMKSAGCEIVCFGVESGSNKILKEIKKGITVKQIIKAFSNAKKAGLLTEANIIVGLPKEKLNDIIRTVDLLKKIKPDYLSVHIGTIFPGTELYDIALKKGIINENDWLKEKSNFYYTENFNELQLHLLKIKIEMKLLRFTRKPVFQMIEKIKYYFNIKKMPTYIKLFIRHTIQ